MRSQPTSCDGDEGGVNTVETRAEPADGDRPRRGRAYRNAGGRPNRAGAARRCRRPTAGRALRPPARSQPTEVSHASSTSSPRAAGRSAPAPGQQVGQRPLAHHVDEHGCRARQRGPGHHRARHPAGPPQGHGRHEQVHPEHHEGERPVRAEAVGAVAARPHQAARRGREEHGIPGPADQCGVGGRVGALAQQQVDAPADHHLQGGDRDEGGTGHGAGAGAVGVVEQRRGGDGQQGDRGQGSAGDAGAAPLHGGDGADPLRQRRPRGPAPRSGPATGSRGAPACGGGRAGSRGRRHPASVARRCGCGLSGTTLSRPRPHPGRHRAGASRAGRADTSAPPAPQDPDLREGSPDRRLAALVRAPCAGGACSMAPTRIDRRSALKGLAAGTAALAVPRVFDPVAAAAPAAKGIFGYGVASGDPTGHVGGDLDPGHPAEPTGRAGRGAGQRARQAAAGALGGRARPGLPARRGARERAHLGRQRPHPQGRRHRPGALHALLLPVREPRRAQPGGPYPHRPRRARRGARAALRPGQLQQLHRRLLHRLPGHRAARRPRPRAARRRLHLRVRQRRRSLRPARAGRRARRAARHRDHRPRGLPAAPRAAQGRPGRAGRRTARSRGSRSSTTTRSPTTPGRTAPRTTRPTRAPTSPAGRTP